MPRGSEGTKCCHLIWVTRDGRSWFKIAAAARFCERALHHACTTLGWIPEVVAVFPERVHLLVRVPAAEDRRTISARLQGAATQLLADGNVLPDTAGPVWAGLGWCAVLPNAVGASTVRRLLREKLAASDGGASAPSSELEIG